MITVSLNSAKTLPDTLNSVQAQTTPVEHVLVDGGSTDGSRDILERYSTPGKRTVFEPDRGLYDALNKGIQHATGKIVGALHADDFFADRHVVRDVISAFSDPLIDGVYGDLAYVDRNHKDRIVRLWQAGDYSPKKLYAGWMPPHPTFFVRRECYEKYGLYRLDLGTAADYEFMLRFLLVHGIRLKYIPRVLVKMRVGGASNASLRARLRAHRMDRKAWKVNGLRPYPWTLLAKPLRKVGQWWVR